MSGDILLDAVSWVLLIAGGAFVFIGGVGALRMPDLYTRIHAAGITDTLGTILVLGGLMPQAGFSIALIKLIAILIFAMLASPTAAYALANAAGLSGLRAEDYVNKSEEDR